MNQSHREPLSGSPSAPQLRVVVAQHQDDVFIVRITGEAQLREVDELDRQLRPLASLRPRLFLIDLADLTFISSLGLGIFVALQRGLTRNGSIVRFVSPQPSVRDVITRCRLDSVLKLYPDMTAALVID